MINIRHIKEADTYIGSRCRKQVVIHQHALSLYRESSALVACSSRRGACVKWTQTARPFVRVCVYVTRRDPPIEWLTTIYSVAHKVSHYQKIKNRITSY